MLRQLLVGASASIFNIAIHALVMAIVIRVTRAVHEITTSHPSFRLIAVMISTMSVLMLAHLAEVLVWASIYAAIGVAPAGGGRVDFYFAFVNYTTLGYGDIAPVAQWRLLGPLTAMNGVLLFGWSTAVIFEVLRSVLTTSRSEAERSTWRA
jgi:hypothetical protein